jgi:hypothetical protein
VKLRSRSPLDPPSIGELVLRLDPSDGVHGRALGRNWSGRVGGGGEPGVGQRGSGCVRWHDKVGSQPGASHVMNGTNGEDNVGGNLLAAVGLFN